MTGFWAVRYGRYNPLTRMSFGWPVGVVQVDDSSLSLDIQPLGAIYHAMTRWSRDPIPVVVQFDQIDRVRAKFDHGIAVARSSRPTPTSG